MTLDESVFFLPATELAKRIKAKQLSPVALTEGYLERLERIGPKLGAVVTVTRDLALAEAKAAEAEIAAGKWRGPLHGVPYGVKDLLATKGIPTTWGAQPYRGQVFGEDATVVTRLRAAGVTMDPDVSEPIENPTRPAAVAAPGPEDEPPDQ